MVSLCELTYTKFAIAQKQECLDVSSKQKEIITGKLDYHMNNISRVDWGSSITNPSISKLILSHTFKILTSKFCIKYIILDKMVKDESFSF